MKIVNKRILLKRNEIHLKLEGSLKLKNVKFPEIPRKNPLPNLELARRNLILKI